MSKVIHYEVVPANSGLFIFYVKNNVLSVLLPPNLLTLKSNAPHCYLLN
jgi:hypothetical protein